MKSERFGKFLFVLVVVANVSISGYPQTNGFSYQGSLNDGSASANGNYDFEFLLFDSETGGNQVGQTVAQTDVIVTDGLFSVVLDFGDQFDGSNRFLEIRVRASANSAVNGAIGGFTTLAPRKQLTSVPYAVRSKNSTSADTALSADFATNASQLGGVPSTDYVETNDARLSDERSPSAGSPNYIQNGSSIQSSAGFNVDGTGSATVFDATSQFNIAGNRVLNISGSANTFVGRTGFGGSSNSLLGNSAGLVSLGSSNAMFGSSAGLANSSGNGNSFFGRNSGRANTTGGVNTFLGFNAGLANTTGSNNTIVGSNASLSAGNLTYATAIGSGAIVSTSNRVVIGRGAGLDTVDVPGVLDVSRTVLANLMRSSIGYDIGTERVLSVGTGSIFVGVRAGESNTAGHSNTFVGVDAGRRNTVGQENSLFGTDAGESLISGIRNAIFGRSAGASSTASDNSFFGAYSGNRNSTGTKNVLIGRSSGFLNTTGSSNTFVGHSSGSSNTTGSNVTLIGAEADITSLGITYATAIGAGATVGSNSTIVIGRATGADKVEIPGLLDVGGTLKVGTFQPGGITEVCKTSSGILSDCSSSMRYKSDIRTFQRGLDLIRQLRPVTFVWNQDRSADMGFVAEEVSGAEPLLATYRKGRVEGVKYSRIAAVLVNAVKQQQQLIERQKKDLELQKSKIEFMQRDVQSLIAAVCAIKPTSAVCSNRPLKKD